MKDWDADYESESKGDLWLTMEAALIGILIVNGIGVAVFKLLAG